MQSQPTANKALIGVGAILGGALLFVSEIDTVLEVAGIFAAGNFALRNLLFADDRKRTQGEIKQAPTHFTAHIKQLETSESD